jgi:hypothetical protein
MKGNKHSHLAGLIRQVFGDREHEFSKQPILEGCMRPAQANVHPVPADGNTRRELTLRNPLNSTEREACEVRALVVEFRVADAVPTCGWNVRWRRHLHAEGSVEDVAHDEGVGPKLVEGNKPVIGWASGHSSRLRFYL